MRPVWHGPAPRSKTVCEIPGTPLDQAKIKVTLKINKTELSHITATLERFGYRIIGRFQEVESKSNDKERYDMLMKYLDI